VIVMPAIDIMRGRAVRLVRGRAEAQRVYADDPVKVAEGFTSEGARWLHVVDLDAALGTGDNRSVIHRLVATPGVSIQVGGGLRSPGEVELALAVGAERIVVGTEAVNDERFLSSIVKAFGDQVVAALDTEGDVVRIRGWTRGAGPLPDVLARVEGAGAPRLLVTAVSRDGTMTGPDIDLYERLRGLTDLPIIASGGIRSVSDLQALAATGVEGAVVGTALYEGTLKLSQAFEVA
jgi:phosphoribosylformimino-5-aminoimidazole carboxamide ribotide isomerase